MRPEQFESWLTVDARGLYCRPGGFHIDPHAAVNRAVITHAHSDHARPGHDHVLATRETLALMKTRLGTAAKLGTQTLAYGETLQVGDVTVKLVPAGHVLGSAQVVIEWRGRARRDLRRLQAKRRPDHARPSSSCRAICSSPRRPSRCRCSSHGDAKAEVAKLLKSRTQFPERAHVVGVYGLGKCQRLIALLREAGYDRPIYLHGALVECCALYERFGVELGELKPATGTKREEMKGADRARTAFRNRRPLVAPPAGPAHRVRLGLDAGARPRAPARRRAAARHLRSCGLARADRTIAETGAREVWVTHGREDALLHHIAIDGPARPGAGADRPRG